MIWLSGFLFLLAAIVCYMLFAPFYLEINSTTGMCRVRFHRLAVARLILADSSLKIDVGIIWWHKQIDLSTIPEQPAKEEKPNPVKKKRGKAKFSLNMAKAVIKTFNVNKCILNIDTGDVQLNGMLYPAFYLLGAYSNRPLGINFLNQNDIILEIENNFARILKAFIFSSLKNKKEHEQLK